MDLFNKKKISQLEFEISKLKIAIENLKDFKQDFDKPKCEDARWDIFDKYLGAIIDYLGIEMKWEWKDDPSYYLPQPRQIKVLRVYKKKRINSTSLKKKAE